MPTDLAGMVTDVTSVINGVVPLTSVGLMAFFGFAVTAGALMVKRFSKALR